MAFGFSSNPFVSASGVPDRSTAQGVDPVVSMPMAATLLPALLRPALASAPFTRRFHALDVVQRMLAEHVLRRVAVFPRRPAAVPGDLVRQLLARLGVDDHRANGIGAEVDPDDQRFPGHCFLLCLRARDAGPFPVSHSPVVFPDGAFTISDSALTILDGSPRS